jgi:steroid delta-isomerase-like uncharacterized protein
LLLLTRNARAATEDRKDESMAAQENIALARSLLELYNSRQSDPAWLDKSVAVFAADSEVIEVPSGTTLHGPEGYKRLIRFFAEAFPDSRVETTNAFATEDQVVLEFTSRGTSIDPLHLPSGAFPATGRSYELRLCQVMQIRHGKIVSYRNYYDMLTLLEQLDLKSATGQAT